MSKQSCVYVKQQNLIKEAVVYLEPSKALHLMKRRYKFPSSFYGPTSAICRQALRHRGILTI